MQINTVASYSLITQTNYFNNIQIHNLASNSYSNAVIMKADKLKTEVFGLKYSRLEKSLRKSESKLLSIKISKLNKEKFHSTNISPNQQLKTRRSSIQSLIQPSQKSSPFQAIREKSNNSPQVSTIISHKSHRKTLSECFIPTKLQVPNPKLPRKKSSKKRINKIQSEFKLKKTPKAVKNYFSPYDTKEKSNRNLLIQKLSEYYFVNKTYPETTFEYYKIVNVIGIGAYSKVILCQHRLTGKKVAIKAIPKGQITSRHAQEKVLREIYILKTVESENVIRIFEVFESEKNILIVLEYAGGGDLLNYVRSKGKLHEKEARLIFHQLVKGALDLHNQGILHRDFKLENILIDSKYSTIKICDFGVSKIINEGEVIFEQCGTPAYLAPEIIKNQGYKDYSVDTWSLGVVLYAMVCGKIPFMSESVPEIHKLILLGQFDIPDFISPRLSSLIIQMLQTSPITRITLKKVLKHPWFTIQDPAIPDSSLPQFKPRLSQKTSQKTSKILEKVVKEVSELGFDYNFIISSLKSKELNHATATYFLLL